MRYHVDTTLSKRMTWQMLMLSPCMRVLLLADCVTKKCIRFYTLTLSLMHHKWR